MDTPAILIKITGFVLFLVTLRSIYKHIQEKRKAAGTKEKDQSNSEKLFNGLLLYVWFLFMSAFSLGMIFNN
ncbi:hypothetical protein QA601_11155 [Chitinispirillales bacterium ANBcel5]|uniref:hypothetical protein n=1 Tax=Cellulosispirillum alkaliphilum TaxID=3039283 RepID=UPI002A56412B|nr:hypothetical protein [Chitinispirillales bacterium ANBcel5]